jgi:hypothetical protein
MRRNEKCNSIVKKEHTGQNKIQVFTGSNTANNVVHFVTYTTIRRKKKLFSFKTILSNNNIYSNIMLNIRLTDT